MVRNNFDDATVMLKNALYKFVKANNPYGT
jgi:hypothetical protein